jgi:LEA14-like dessication related protein
LKTSDLLIIGAIAAAGYYLLNKSRAVGTLIFVPRGVSFGGGGMQVTIGVQNPTNTPLTLSSIFGTVFLNGDSIGNISDSIQQVINPNQETPVVINLTPNLLGLTKLAAGTLQGGTLSDLSFTVTGYANVDQNTFPVNFNFSPSL